MIKLVGSTFKKFSRVRLEVPEDFYGDQKVYRLRTFIPDFLRIQEDPVTKARSIFIIDAKSSEALSSSHQVKKKQCDGVDCQNFFYML